MNDEKAFEYFQMAEDNITDAKAYVGHYYHCGWGGVEVDKDKANALFELAESKGSIMVLYFQAMYSIFEDESEERFDKTIELCQQVIDAGYDKGYGLLGFCYLDEDSPVHDYEKAVYWLQCAADQNSARAQELLGECYENG